MLQSYPVVNGDDSPSVLKARITFGTLLKMQDMRPKQSLFFQMADHLCHLPEYNKKKSVSDFNFFLKLILSLGFPDFLVLGNCSTVLPPVFDLNFFPHRKFY